MYRYAPFNRELRKGSVVGVWAGGGRLPDSAPIDPGVWNVESLTRSVTSGQSCFTIASAEQN